MDGQPRLASGPSATPPPPPPRLKARKKAKKKAPHVFVPVELPEQEPLFDRSLVVGLLLALLALPPVGWLFLTAVPDAPQLLQQIVEFTIIEPPPEPEPEPTPPPPPPKKEVKKVDMEKVNEPIPTDVAVDEPIEESKPIFGLTMDSTVEGNSGFKMRVGNTLNIEPDDEFVPPEDVKPLRAVSFARLEEPPKLVRDYRAEYPEGPRSEGIEGTVIMKLTISETGKVTAVKIVRGVHPELDAAAKAAAFRFVYKPGTDGGETVITTNFVHHYTWLIEG